MRPDAASWATPHAARSNANAAKVSRTASNSTSENLGPSAHPLQLAVTSETTRRRDESAENLILHEALKGLIMSVRHLDKRCTDLEAENDSLKDGVAAMKESVGLLALQRSEPEVSARNVSGYASSHSSDGELYFTHIIHTTS